MLLSATGLSKWFGATRALHNASLDVRGGEVHALVGANGSGKSTLVKVLSGRLHADRGEVTVVTGTALGTVHQNLGLFAEGTVRENICGTLTRGLLSRTREEAMVGLLLGQLGVSLPADRKLQDLALDEQALVAVARAMAATDGAPGAVLIVDEVTSVLRGRSAQRFASVLRRLRDQGIGIVLVSHDLDEVLGLADRITVMVDGSVRAVASAASVDRASLIELMTGHQPAAARSVLPPRRGPARDTVLQVSGLAATLVHGLDFEVRAGEVVGVIGVPGSGYEEVPYLVAGTGLPERRGDVRVAGLAVTDAASFARAGGRIVSADRGRTALVRSGTVLENFLLDHRGGRGRWGLRRPGAERSAAAEAVRRYGVKCQDTASPITSLSGGNQQKLIMARCLASRPRLLVVHEPTQGVDVQARAELLSHMHCAVSEHGIGVLYVCGDLAEAWENCHRIIVVRRGVLGGEVTVAEDSQESLHQLLY
ncbi:ATP-binding cassette domain-containing protein [Streptomyces puniciscabiei]